MRLAVVVPFLDEEQYLEDLLDSIEHQSRHPDKLLLVDDGSTDRSPAIAEAFAQRFSWVEVVRRPPKQPQRDRLVRAAELQAFEHGRQQLDERSYDVIAKLDADLHLSGEVFAEMERRFEDQPMLGLAGAYLTMVDPATGEKRRQRCPPGHVEGPTKFYRRQCLEQISPLPTIPGWETIDEVRARLRGWQTESFEVPGGDPEHRRRMGSQDGLLRGYRRAGLAAYNYGSHPLMVLVSAAVRAWEHPKLLCGAHYLAGWVIAVVRRPARAEREVVHLTRVEQGRRVRSLLRWPGNH